MDEEPAPVLGVLLDPVVQRLDLLLVEEPQYPLLQLARALAGMISTSVAFLATASSMIPAQRPIDVLAAVEDVVEVEL